MPLKNRKADEEFGFDKYNSIEMINNFLNDINAKYPDITGVLTIGESFEGRPIKGIKIVKNPENPAIFIEANIHAREWISSATAVWIINELLSSEDSNVKNIVDNISWYIIPVSNPDGYEYTRSDDRLWRKTRSDHNILCRGVDPNRNFGFNWRRESVKLKDYRNKDLFNFLQRVVHQTLLALKLMLVLHHFPKRRLKH